MTSGTAKLVLCLFYCV